MTAGVTSITRTRAVARKKQSARTSTARTSVLLLILVATLIVVGLGAILSASSVVALTRTGDRFHFFERQLAWAAIGGVVLVATARIPYRHYRRLALPIFLVGVAGLVAVLLVGEVRGGSRRWIVAGPVQLQPSEFAKFTTVVFLASAMSAKERLLRDLGHFAVPVLTSVGTVGALVMLQPDLGTTLIIGIASLTVMAVSPAPLRYVAGSGVMASVLAAVLSVASPYRRARVSAFFDPFADPLGDGFQVVQSLLALGTGGWFGVGLGASRARWSFLPNAHTDFIFAIIGEETGFAGALVVLLLFTAFTVVGMTIAFRAPDRFGRLLAAGIVAWVAAQALVNVGAVTAVVPVTGIPLPFVSFGGSALVTSMAAVGVLLNVAGTDGGRR